MRGKVTLLQFGDASGVTEKPHVHRGVHQIGRFVDFREETYDETLETCPSNFISPWINGEITLGKCFTISQDEFDHPAT